MPSRTSKTSYYSKVNRSCRVQKLNKQKNRLSPHCPKRSPFQANGTPNMTVSQKVLTLTFFASIKMYGVSTATPFHMMLRQVQVSSPEAS